MTNNCKHCHFMASDLNKYGTDPKTLTEEQRKLVEPQRGSTWGCYRRVWNTGSLPHDDNAGAARKGAFKVQMLKDRRESCFFIEYRKGIEWPAAEDLQRLEYENRNLKKSYRMTQWGLFIAGISLAINAIFQVVNFLLQISWLPGWWH